jgi:hypothetical protein
LLRIFLRHPSRKGRVAGFPGDREAFGRAFAIVTARISVDVWTDQRRLPICGAPSRLIFSIGKGGSTTIGRNSASSNIPAMTTKKDVEREIKQGSRSFTIWPTLGSPSSSLLCSFRRQYTRLLAIIDRVEAEGVVALRVPLRVELKAGPNWAELTSQASGS